MRLLESLIVKNGGLDDARNQSTFHPFLRDVGSSLLEDENSPPDMRLRLNSIVMLIGRYATMQEVRLKELYPVAEGQDIHQVVEDHLVEVALVLCC